MLKVIGGAQEGEFKAVASGTLPNGKPVAVNADGTVSVITGASAATGSEVVYQAGDAEYSASAYSSSDNKVVVFWKQGGNAIYGAVGTVSGTSISFGSPVLTNNYGEPVNVVYDSTNNKFVVAYRDSANNGDAFVATISGTSLSFGSTATFASSSSANHINPVFDSNAGKVVICYTDTNNSSYGTAVVGTVSGTSISFGSPVVFNSANTFNSQRANAATFDSSNNKVVIAYQDVGNSNYGTAIIGTVSGTSISFGSESTWTTNSTNRVICSYDTDQNKVVIFYRDQTDANLNKAVIGTVSGTSISYGTPATVYDSVGSYGRSNRISYNAAAKKHLISFIDDTTGDSYFVELKVSGNSFTSTPAVVYATSSSSYGTISYDSGSEVNIIFFQDGDNSLYGTAFVKRLDSTNLTSENYIGMSSGPASPETLGSAVTFTTAAPQYLCGVYDTNAQKVVLAYNDNQNSNHGTAVVGTVVGTTISFGTPVVFEAAVTNQISMAYDSTNNKVVLSYEDEGNSNYGTSIVGTVSGTSISFGTPTVFQSSNIGSGTATVYDTNAQKVVVYFEDGTNGKGIVGTVSGTSISFGTAVEFNSGTTQYTFATYDSTANKSIVVYRDAGNSSYGTARVGTVSGTSISFGSEAVFNAGNTEFPKINYDATSNKSVIFFKDASDSDKGKVIIGTVSGTSISFGSEVDVTTGGVFDLAVSSSPASGKFILAYRDASNSSYGTYRFGTISGTTPTLETASVFNEANTQRNFIVYDPNNTNLVLSYQDGGNSSASTSKVLQEASGGSIADGDPATIDIIGAVSTNQGGLTAGQQYFVQTDGTIGLTAADPSVLAGTAISATELLVKT